MFTKGTSAIEFHLNIVFCHIDDAHNIHYLVRNTIAYMGTYYCHSRILIRFVMTYELFRFDIERK